MGSFTARHEFPNGVNIIVIPDVCVTVASYDDLECEVSHVLYFMTTDYHGNTVEALLIIKLLRCSLQAKISLDFTHFLQIKSNL